MARIALVVGAQTDGLEGVGYDVEQMASLLAAREFAVRTCTGTDATRAGILDEYERLIADSTEDDAVVIYYSGHGGYAQPPEDPTENELNSVVTKPTGQTFSRPDMRFLVPVDIAESTPGDFRGITALELSVRLARLTAVTRNVTVILDCCHASYMSREPAGFVAKSRPHRAYADIVAHDAAAVRAGLPVEMTDPISNPYAVRLAACAPWELAYEYPGITGRRTGVLTESLGVVLAEAGDAPVSWSMVVQRVRERVQLRARGQRPEVEGPASRLLFDTGTAASTGMMPAMPAGPGRVRLPGARLLGVSPGDQLELVTHVRGATDQPSITATVDGIEGATVMARIDATGVRAGRSVTRTEADAEADAANPPADLTTWKIPPGVQARPLRTRAPLHPVAVTGDGAFARTVRDAVESAPLLRVAGAGEPPLARVVVGQASMTVEDSLGASVHPLPATRDGLTAVLAQLHRQVRAQTLRSFSPDEAELLTDQFSLDWGRVVEGQTRPLPLAGGVMHSGERAYLRFVNNSDRDLYVTALDIGVSNAVQIITAADRSGLRVRPGEEQIIGQRAGGAIAGTPLYWPDEVPAEDARPETIVVVVSSQRQDLSPLEWDSLPDGGHAAAARALAAGSTLQRVAAQMTLGGSREWPQSEGPSIRYAMRRVDFTLHPAPAPSEETARFIVDDRPDVSYRLLGARTRSAARPSMVAVRLTELVVRRNRALGSADIRLDALVLTGGPEATPAYRAQTLRFHNIRDGQRLPLDNLLTYHGPAVDFLDIAWWVSRDRGNSLELADLLSQELNSEHVRQAAIQMTGLAMAAPQATAAVLAVGGTAVIVNLAYQVLSKAVGDSIGLYRTSLLAMENFGIGRHPATGLRDAQDFAFAYEVVATG